MEYNFYKEDGDAASIYLDTISKKEIFNEDFVVDEQYIIYYEPETQIIVGVEKIEP